MPLSKGLYHTCFIRGQRCKWWSHLLKLTSSVITDVKPIIYSYIFYIVPLTRYCDIIMHTHKLKVTHHWRWQRSETDAPLALIWGRQLKSSRFIAPKTCAYPRNTGYFSISPSSAFGRDWGTSWSLCNFHLDRLIWTLQNCVHEHFHDVMLLCTVPASRHKRIVTL